MKPAGTGRSHDGESTAFAAWYASHPNVRHLWAIRDAHRLQVFVTLEPTHDDSDTCPAWFAHRNAWESELQLCTNLPVQLRRREEPAFDRARTDAASVIVVSLSWRDPASI